MNPGPTLLSSYGTISVVVMLTVLLVALKLTDQIGWSWWWVLAPVWLAAIFGVISIALALIFARDYSDHGDWQ